MSAVMIGGKYIAVIKGLTGLRRKVEVEVIKVYSTEEGVELVSLKNLDNGSPLRFVKNYPVDMLLPYEKLK